MTCCPVLRGGVQPDEPSLIKFRPIVIQAEKSIKALENRGLIAVAKVATAYYDMAGEPCKVSLYAISVDHDGY
jgi:hypothetical protein